MSFRAAESLHCLDRFFTQRAASSRIDSSFACSCPKNNRQFNRIQEQKRTNNYLGNTKPNRINKDLKTFWTVSHLKDFCRVPTHVEKGRWRRL